VGSVNNGDWRELVSEVLGKIAKALLQAKPIIMKLKST
jgi:hypothetical protein